jgi:hypothetical protein
LGLALAIVATASARADEKVAFSRCPAAVKKTLRRESREARIDTVTKVTEDGETTYLAGVTLDGNKYEIEVAEDGSLIEKSLDVDERDIAFSAAPAAVRKTFDEEARGAQIESLSKEADHGTTLYGAVVAVDGKKYAIKVAEDGSLTEKTFRFDEQEVELANCPIGVRKTLNDESRGGKIVEIVRSTGLGKRVYAASVDFDDETYILEVGEDGTLLAKLLDEEE